MILKKLLVLVVAFMAICLVATIVYVKKKKKKGYWIALWAVQIILILTVNFNLNEINVLIWHSSGLLTYVHRNGNERVKESSGGLLPDSSFSLFTHQF